MASTHDQDMHKLHAAVAWTWLHPVTLNYVPYVTFYAIRAIFSFYFTLYIFQCFTQMWAQPNGHFTAVDSMFDDTVASLINEGADVNILNSKGHTHCCASETIQYYRTSFVRSNTALFYCFSLTDIVSMLLLKNCEATLLKGRFSDVWKRLAPSVLNCQILKLVMCDGAQAKTLVFTPEYSSRNVDTNTL